METKAIRDTVEEKNPSHDSASANKQADNSRHRPNLFLPTLMFPHSSLTL